MSIVNEDQMHAALLYLGIDPHPIAVARGTLLKAENKRKLTYSIGFVSQQGKSIADRQAIVEVSQPYQDAISAEENATVEFERHRARVKHAEWIIETWRSEGARERAADRGAR